MLGSPEGDDIDDHITMPWCTGLQAVDGASADAAGRIEFSQTAQLLFLLAGVTLFLGPTLPWVEIPGPHMRSSNGLQQTHGEAFFIVAFGGAVVLSSIISLYRSRDQTMMVPFFFGASAAVMSLAYYNNLRSSIASFESQSYSAFVGGGLYMCLVGGLALCAGLAIAFRNALVNARR